MSAIPSEDQYANTNDSVSQSPRAKPAQATSSEIPIVKFSVIPAQVEQIMSEKVPVVQDYMSWNTTSNIDHHQISLMTALPKAIVTDLDLNTNSVNEAQHLSLNLSLSLPSDGSNLSRQSPFHAMPSFFSGDSMISVG